MTKFKKALAILIALVLVTPSAALSSNAMEAASIDIQEPASNVITILHTNDVHCGGVSDYGYAKLAAYKKGLENSSLKNVIMVDAGDHIQGETIGTLTKGSAIVDIMNTIGYDLAVPGNHEFDYQMATFNARKTQANYPYISSNFYDLKTNKPYLDQYKIVEACGHKIGFVGINTPETYTKSTPKYFQDDKGNYIYSFMENNFYPTIQAGIDACKAAGAEKVVAVAHTGIEGSEVAWNSQSIIANTTGIDLYIDGHSHEANVTTFTSKDGKVVPYTQTGTKLEKIGRIDITIEGDNLTISTPSLVQVSGLVDMDAQVKSMLDDDNALVTNFAGESVGSSEVTLYAKDPSTGDRISNRENPLGNFIADAYKWKTKADIGLINSGGIRANINEGALIANNLISVNPWMNDIGVIEATGQTILDALEHSARLAPGTNNGFLQVSGIKYEVNTNIESPVVLNTDNSFKEIDSSKPRRVKNVYVNGKKISATQKYTIGSTLYLLQNAGDGYTMFSDCKVKTGAAYVFPTDAEILIDYMKTSLKGVIKADTYGKTQGRITVSDDRSNYIYRLYNRNSGEHLFTSKLAEYNKLKKAGWVQEGECFDAFTEETKPANASAVYRMYNPNVKGGDHHYTKSVSETNKLVKAGWKRDNGGKPLFYTVGAYPVYKFYHKKSGRHHYTPKEAEAKTLVKNGWIKEGTGWTTMGYYTNSAHTVTPIEVEVQVDVIHTNDVHCGGVADYRYARLAQLKKDLESESEKDGVITVDAGDHIQGETIGTLTKGAALIDIMNTIGYDVATPGNHEFDYQMSTFASRRSEAKFTYVSSNFYNLKTKKPYLDQYKIIEKGGVKFGFVGISTPETYTKSTPKYFQDDKGNYIYSFMEDKFYATIQSGIDACKKAGADVVIALAHTGIEGSEVKWNSQSIIANTTGIDLYIDGHSHEANSTVFPNKDNKDVTYTQTGTKLENIGVAMLYYDTYSGEVGIEATLVETDTYEVMDETVQAKLTAYNEQVTAFSGEAIGSSEVTLYAKDPETGDRITNRESRLGNLIADAYRWKTNADIGLINSGGIRANIKEGDLIADDLIKVNPWMNDVGVIEAKGQTILDALEHGARNAPGANNGFLQVSGLTYEIDTTIPSPVELNTDNSFKSIDSTKQRRVKNVKVGSANIDPNKTYTIGSTLYLLQNAGDGYTMFSDCKVKTGAAYVFPTDAEILVEYMKQELKGVIPASKYGERQGRITVIIPD